MCIFDSCFKQALVLILGNGLGVRMLSRLPRKLNLLDLSLLSVTLISALTVLDHSRRALPTQGLVLLPILPGSVMQIN